jgi:hypothetical protein
MARIRSIKPEFWSSEQVMSCSVPARLLFIGLWNFCDDCGHHPLAPKQIKALVFPGDTDVTPEVVRVLLGELSANGLIAVYAVDGRDYLEVTGWRHQKIDKPQKPKFPQPVGSPSSNARRMVATEGSPEYRLDEKGIGSDHILAEEREAPSRRGDFVDLKTSYPDSLNGDAAGTPRRPTDLATLIDPGFRPASGLIDQCYRDGATESVINEEIGKFIAKQREKGYLSHDWNSSWTIWWSRWKDRGNKKTVSDGASCKHNIALPYQPTESDWNAVCKRYAANNSQWSRQLGPEPGQRGCRCPIKIMLKHGIDPDTGLKLMASQQDYSGDSQLIDCGASGAKG